MSNDDRDHRNELADTLIDMKSRLIQSYNILINAQNEIRNLTKASESVEKDWRHASTGFGEDPL